MSSGQIKTGIMSVRDSHIESGKPQVKGIMIEKSLDEAADNASDPQTG
jgi:hypothetical protein